MKAVIYSRVSTDDQTIANQELILIDWAKRRGDNLAGVYSETASAWKNGHQKELSRLIKAAHQRRFDTILVWSLDRLSREGPLAILSLIHKLGTYGVKVVSYQEPWTEAPSEFTDILLAFTGWVAQFESRRRSERTKAGIERKRKQGFRWGRPPGNKTALLKTPGLAQAQKTTSRTGGQKRNLFLGG